MLLALFKESHKLYYNFYQKKSSPNLKIRRIENIGHCSFHNTSFKLKSRLFFALFVRQSRTSIWNTQSLKAVILRGQNLHPPTLRPDRKSVVKVTGRKFLRTSGILFQILNASY